ncbi:MAG: nucleotide pyrophosphohydrolase [Simkaniaceae bacterium]|nr:nucleotide pyrophosphohydrolase [Simkaniaceae bacterium]
MHREYKELLPKIIEFYRVRDWEQFHAPKNVAMSLASEVGELLDPLRWLTCEQSENPDEKTMQELREEIGDVFRNIVYLAHTLGIDPIEASFEKLEAMEEKYPAEASRGRIDKWTTYTQESLEIVT